MALNEETGIYTCDGCGQEAQGEELHGKWWKPGPWYSRGGGKADDPEQHACSRQCIEITAKKTGKTAVVAPF